VAHVVGSAGSTAQRVESERLLLVGSDPGRHASLWGMGIGSGLAAWALGWGGAPPLVALSFAVAGAATLWLLVAATPAGRAVARWAGGALHAVALTTDAALAAGLGTVAASCAHPLASPLPRLILGAGGAALAAASWKARVEGAQGAIARLAAGLRGEDRVARELRRLPDDYVVLTDLVLSTPAGTREIDHLVLGPSGIYVVEVKRWGGVITPGQDAWIQETRRGRFPRPSPAAQLERARQSVASRLGVPASAVTPILVLVGGRLAGPSPVRVESPGSLREAIEHAPPAWPLSVTPLEAAQSFLPPP
jgi:hypothetical protein